MREHLLHRYRYLVSGEAVSAALFGCLYISFVGRDGWQWQNWWLEGYALICLLLILIQGVALWTHKYKQLQQGTLLLSTRMRWWLPHWRTVNWLLIGSYPVLAVVWGGLLSNATSRDIWVGAGIWLFSIAEQINYYYYQLCYDNKSDVDYLLTHRQLKRGFVARDLKQ